MNITVYLGANKGNDPKLSEAVKELGEWIGKNGHSLVYGGSYNGLMGYIADAVLDKGGKVTGVEPKKFIELGYQHENITKLIVTETMSERKNLMAKLGDAFIAFPGGTGTLEEISEIMSRAALDDIDAPCIIYNLNHYYDGLEQLLNRMIEDGLSDEYRQRNIYFCENMTEIEEILKGVRLV